MSSRYGEFSLACSLLSEFIFTSWNYSQFTTNVPLCYLMISDTTAKLLRILNSLCMCPCFFLIRGGGRASEAAGRAPSEASLFLGVPASSRDGHEEETGRRRPLVFVLELQHSAQHTVPQRGWETPLDWLDHRPRAETMMPITGSEYCSFSTVELCNLASRWTNES